MAREVVKTETDGSDNGLSDRILVELNPGWAVGYNEWHWILLQRTGKTWRGRKFIVERNHLLKCISELVPEARKTALTTIRSWPQYFAVWARQRKLRG